MNTNHPIEPWVVTLVAISGCFVVGCGSPGKEDVVGVYERSFQGVSETLVLISNGTHRQTIRYADGRTWATNATWLLKGRGIDIDDFYVTYDVLRKAIVDPPRLSNLVPYAWEKGRLFREYEPVWEKQ